MSGFSNDIPRLERVLCTMFTTYLGVFACHSLTVRLLTGVIKKKTLHRIFAVRRYQFMSKRGYECRGKRGSEKGGSEVVFTLHGSVQQQRMKD